MRLGFFVPSPSSPGLTLEDENSLSPPPPSYKMVSYAAAVLMSRSPHSVSDKEVQALDSQIDAKLQLSSIPTSSAPTYAERFKASLRNLRKISDPTYLEDGTSVVQALPVVLLQASELWKDHIVTHFHGRRPHPAKIIADLNPVWEKIGNITVRTISITSCLPFRPLLLHTVCKSSRKAWRLIHFCHPINKLCSIMSLPFNHSNCHLIIRKNDETNS